MPRPSLKILPAVVACAVAGATLAACGDEKRSFVDNVTPDTPTLTTVDVQTYISDSGYTRFYIETPLWEMYDDAEDPFWFFPDGLALDQYDRDMRVVASIRCDTARYLSQQRIWRLRGNVEMVNSLRDSFLTQVMFWDQNRREVYSDSFVHIVKSDRIIEGYGFRSNENITEYTILNPTGIFPVENMRDRENTQRADTDTITRNDTPGRRRIIPPRQSRRTDSTGALLLQPTPIPGAYNP